MLSEEARGLRRGGAQKPQHATAHERWLACCCTQERVAVRHCGAEARKHSLRPDTAARWAAGARCGPKLRRVRRQGSALGTGRAGFISVMHCEFTATCSPAPAEGKRGGSFNSVSRRFINDLNSLMGDLNATDAHFIRCVKPNMQQTPGSFKYGAIRDPYGTI